MRLIRVMIAILAVVVLGLAFAYLPTRAMRSETAASSGTTFLPFVTQQPQESTGNGTPAVPTSAATPVAGLYTYTFHIDRSATPKLSYNELSYVVHLGAASNVSVLIKDKAVESSYDSASGNVVFSTTLSGSVAVRFASASTPAEISVSKASLKDNKAWAWSHGMDDNVNLQGQVDAISEKGWRGSLMLIAKDIDDDRDEGWIFDKPALRKLRNQGWSLADHSWNHNCNEGDSAENLRKTITDGYDKLMEIVETSDDPSYQVLTFAAPCFISAYDPIFKDLVESGDTTLRFNESQGNPLMNVDGTDYTADEVTASAMSASNQKIGRNADVDVDEDKAIATLDWMAAHKGEGRHFWFNTLSHGSETDGKLVSMLDHAYSQYGPGGTNELWMAPSDEIYSYLLVRDSTVVSPGSLISPA